MIKLYNRRVKGTEKFWSEEGAEAILQLRSDYLNETEPLRASGRDAKPRLLGDATSDASREKLLTSPVVHPSWLEKQMLKRRLGFNLQDNAFTVLDDPEAAQRLADSFVHQNGARSSTAWPGRSIRC